MGSWTTSSLPTDELARGSVAVVDEDERCPEFSGNSEFLWRVHLHERLGEVK